METNKVLLEEIELSKIDLGENVRLEESVNTLMLSIKNQGLLQPVGLLRKEDGRYKLIFGYKRLKAIQSLGWVKIPALVSEIEFATEKEMDRYFLITNLTENTYEKPSAFEQGKRYLKLMDEFHMSVAEIRVIVGETESAINDDIYIAKSRVPEEYLHKIKRASPGRSGTNNAGTIPLNLAKTLIQKVGNAHFGKDKTKELWDYAIVHEIHQAELDLMIEIMLRLNVSLADAVKISKKCMSKTLRYVINREVAEKLSSEYGGSVTTIMERIVRGEIPPAKNLIMKRAAASNTKKTKEEKKIEKGMKGQFS